MNNLAVLKTTLKDPWNFPVLSPGAAGRILTRHFTNLALVLDQDQMGLISFLMYYCNADNTFKYSTKLLRQYQKAVEMAGALYGRNSLRASLPHSRAAFKALIERGLLLNAGYKLYMVNPNLGYSREYVKGRFYSQWCKDPRVETFIEHVQKNII